MSRVAGESSEVIGQAKYLAYIVKMVLEKTKKGYTLLDELSETSKDSSYETAKGIVDDIVSVMSNGIESCTEVTDKLMKYSSFLSELERG